MKPSPPLPVLFLAVIGFILGIGGLCLTPLSMLQLLFPGSPEDHTFQIGEMAITMAPPEGAALLGLLACGLVSILCSALLLTGGTGSLMLKGWGRVAMLIYAPLSILNNAAHTVISTMIYAGTFAEQAAANAPGPMPPWMMTLSVLLATLCVILCQAIYPVAVIIVYNLKSVRDAFDGRPPEGGGGMPPGGVDPMWQAPAWPGYQAYQPPTDPNAPPPIPPTGGWGAPPPPAAGNPPQQPPPTPPRW